MRASLALAGLVLAVGLHAPMVDAADPSAPPAPLLVHAEFVGTSEGWEIVEGAGAITFDDGLRLLLDGEELVARSPPLPAGAQGVVVQARRTQTSGWPDDLLVVLDTDGSPLFVVGTWSNRLRIEHGAGLVDKYPKLMGTASHTLAVSWSDGAFDLVVDDVTYPNFAPMGPGVPARIQVAARSGDVTLDAVRVYAAGARRGTGFGDPAGTSVTWSDPGPVHATAWTPTCASAFADPGCVAIRGDATTGARAFGTLDVDDLGDTWIAQIQSASTTQFPPVFHQAIFAGLSAEGEALWALTRAPAIALPEGRGQREAIFLVLPGELPHQLSAPLPIAAIRTTIQAEVAAGTLTVSLDKRPLATLEGLDLASSSHLAFGDVLEGPLPREGNAPAYPASDTGYRGVEVRYDAIWVAPIDGSRSS